MFTTSVSVHKYRHSNSYLKLNKSELLTAIAYCYKFFNMHVVFIVPTSYLVDETGTLATMT